VTIKDLFCTVSWRVPASLLEANSLATIKIHLNRLTRLLGKSDHCQSGYPECRVRTHQFDVKQSVSSVGQESLPIVIRQS
jgi:hypothetical protein